MSRFTQIAELQKLRQDVDELKKASISKDVLLILASKMDNKLAALSARIEALEAKRVGRPKKDE